MKFKNGFRRSDEDTKSDTKIKKIDFRNESYTSVELVQNSKMTERLQGPTPAGVRLREVSVKRELTVAESRFLPPKIHRQRKDEYLNILITFT